MSKFKVGQTVVANKTVPHMFQKGDHVTIVSFLPRNMVELLGIEGQCSEDVLSPLQVTSDPPPSRYHREIKGANLDLYDIAEAYGVTSHRIFHAIKKLMLAGQRGHKDRETDLREAIVSIQSELAKHDAQ